MYGARCKGVVVPEALKVATMTGLSCRCRVAGRHCIVPLSSVRHENAFPLGCQDVPWLGCRIFTYRILRNRPLISDQT